VLQDVHAAVSIHGHILGQDVHSTSANIPHETSPNHDDVTVFRGLDRESLTVDRSGRIRSAA
jgi:hypothetical protein